MFQINEDKSIYATRGDCISISVSAKDDGETFTFQPGSVVRMKVFGKKNCEDVVLKKEFPVSAAAESVELFLTGDDTKFGPVISKPVDYWYEIELNPDTTPQTIIGYDVDGPKIFRLFPEGGEVQV